MIGKDDVLVMNGIELRGQRAEIVMLLMTRGFMTEPEIVEAMRDLGYGVRYHWQSVLRDLKRENLVWSRKTRDGRTAHGDRWYKRLVYSAYRVDRIRALLAKPYTPDYKPRRLDIGAEPWRPSRCPVCFRKTVPEGVAELAEALRLAAGPGEPQNRSSGHSGAEAAAAR